MNLMQGTALPINGRVSLIVSLEPLSFDSPREPESGILSMLREVYRLAQADYDSASIAVAPRKRAAANNGVNSVAVAESPLGFSFHETRMYAGTDPAAGNLMNFGVHVEKTAPETT